MRKKIIGGFIVLSFFIGNNVLADITRTNSLGQTEVYGDDGVIKSVSDSSSSPGVSYDNPPDDPSSTNAEKGTNAGAGGNETINAVNSGNKETTDAAILKDQQEAEAARQPSGGTDTSTSNSTQTSSDAEFAKADYDQLRSQGLSDAEAKKQSGYTGPSTEQQAEAARDAACESSGDCLDKPSFVINTGLFSTSGEGLKTGEAKSTINGILGTLIKKLMIALGIIALFVMTIGAGYMILFRGEDEYLSKGKNIFIGGITALVVALSSYYLVNLVGYILYK